MTVSSLREIRTGSKTVPDCEGCGWQGDDTYFVDSAGAWLCTGCSHDWQNMLEDTEHQAAKAMAS